MFAKSAWFVSLVAAAALGCPVGSATELTTNGGFETGDFTGWTQFPTGVGQQTITTVNSASGSYAAEINNIAVTSNSLIKQANLGMGVVTPGQSVTISFDARGSLGVGGVAFAEFFSEINGGGVSKAQILGSGPLAVNANPNVWTHFAYTTTAGPDVSGGVTLQLGATTGAVVGSTAHMWYDNALVSVVSAGPIYSADFDHNGAVNANDLVVWEGAFGVNALADADGDLDSDGADLLAWQQQLGSGPPATPAFVAIPEPTSGVLLLIVAAGASLAKRRQVAR